ncbi:hypothetical protein PCHDK_000492200 [Plasmodium chabaudi adami]|uniref:Uncharacterized protein n=1 Tax=Plasmodium chabaudi adami TaxID=5826 RepID=A0A1D3L6Z2_PLACE|nr:hypothetical protein PCHDK_000492200 [Plasmodium chabaudi adami]
MNKKLYSLFVFVYLLIAYCATVQGNKNVNGKGDRHESNVIKKKYKKNYNKGNKHMQRSDEDYTDILKENNENFDENKKESAQSISKMGKRRPKNEEISKRMIAYVFGITSITAVAILYYMQECVENTLSNPNSNISKLIDKAVAIKYKKP